eukprot:TRINITY_DN148_c0_g1_i1.p1 TRINITY_DN148_c0_g1~~TRINITY_DN148_c0_g1_i1.p1  ORF type:complete len:326 (-),score=70.55 TRINITY_DN148_c0_g1_i1:207-1139(-)
MGDLTSSRYVFTSIQTVAIPMTGEEVVNRVQTNPNFHALVPLTKDMQLPYLRGLVKKHDVGLKVGERQFDVVMAEHIAISLKKEIALIDQEANAKIKQIEATAMDQAAKAMEKERVQTLADLKKSNQHLQATNKTQQGEIDQLHREFQKQQGKLDVQQGKLDVQQGEIAELRSALDPLVQLRKQLAPGNLVINWWTSKGLVNQAKAAFPSLDMTHVGDVFAWVNSDLEVAQWFDGLCRSMDLDTAIVLQTDKRARKKRNHAAHTLSKLDAFLAVQKEVGSSRGPFMKRMFVELFNIDYDEMEKEYFQRLG